MTWTKTGNEFAADAANVDLTDAAYRTHHEVIEWLYRVERMDCHIPARLVRRVAGSGDYEAAVRQLLDVGFWRRDGDDYEVVHHGDVIRQSLAAQLKKRAEDKVRQRKHRAKISARVTTDVTHDVTHDVAETQSVSHTGISQDTEELGPRTFDDAAWLNGSRP